MIEQVPPERVGELAAVYNEHVAAIPLSDPVSPQRLADIWGWHDDQSARLEAEQAVYAIRAEGRPVGFAHLALGRFPGPELRGDQQPGPTGVVRCLAYTPEHRAAGQALLEAAEAHLAKLGAGRILAFLNNGYSFQRFAYGELPDTCGHLVALLGLNGYRPARGEVFMHYPDFVPEKPPAPETAVELSVDCIPQATGTRDSIKVVASKRGELVGICEGHSLGLWGSSERSQATVVLGPMDVEDAFQGRGWGKFLAHAMLAQARELGYWHTATSTQQENHRAQLFYIGMGYRVTDVAHSWLKDI